MYEHVQAQLQQQQAPSPTAPKPLVIGVVVFERVTMLDYVGPTAYLEALPIVLGILVEFVTISHKQGPLKSTGGVPLYASTGFEDAPEQLDILLIPGAPDVSDAIQDAGLLAYIRKAAERATHVLTVCTGSDILAHTGFLDGKRATTNKMAFNEVVALHPAVQWVRQARWVVDGKIWTSSGVMAGADMGYAFTAALYGSGAADAIAKCLETVPNKDPSNDPFA